MTAPSFTTLYRPKRTHAGVIGLALATAGLALGLLLLVPPVRASGWFMLAVTSAGLITAGLVVSIVGIVRARTAVPRQRITPGVVGLVLAIVGVVGWSLVLVLVALWASSCVLFSENPSCAPLFG